MIHMDFSCDENLHQWSLITKQKTVKSLCGKRVPMKASTVSEDVVDCPQCKARLIEKREGEALLRFLIEAEKISN